MPVIKAKLEKATGVPPEHQKILLGALDQLMLGDKRTNIKFGTCGRTVGLEMSGDQVSRLGPGVKNTFVLDEGKKK